MTLALAAVGAVGVYSATHGAEGVSPLFYDHLRRLGVGLAALLLATLVDYHLILRFAWIAYGFGIAALLAVDVVGMVGMGAQRWLSLGVVSIQPSEFFKLALVLVIAHYFSGLRKPSPFMWTEIWPIVVATAVPFLLVMKQPDLGTALIIAGIFVIMLFVAGVDVRLFAWTAGGGIALAGALFGLNVLGIFNPLKFLRAYQIKRYPGPLRSGSGPARCGLPHQPVQDCDRIGRVHRQGVSGGDSERLEFPAPAAHRLHLFGRF